MQKGLRAALTCQKLVPLTREAIKDGKKETRKLVLKGTFPIFIEGQPKPMTLPAKLEFEDKPEIVELIQTALDIHDVGEECLLTIHSNRQGRLDKYYSWLKKKSGQQELEFGTKEEPETEFEGEEEE